MIGAGPARVRRTAVANPALLFPRRLVRLRRLEVESWRPRRTECMMADTPGMPPAGSVSDRHLYSPVSYRAADGSWHASFFDALSCCPGPVHWDLAGVASFISFGYVCGNRTLLQEVTRKPWLSEIGPDGEPELLEIPPHGRVSKSHERIAEDLERLLRAELVSASRGRSKVCLLLSGGLDSRVVAGISAAAAADGDIEAPISAVTWGLPDSRDVVYAKAVADALGAEWLPLDISPETLLENVEHAASELGCLVSPIHLHRMMWFREYDPEALVLSGSYGDSIGRAEFSRQHLLDIQPLGPRYRYGLMTPWAFEQGRKGLQGDLEELRLRTSGQPRYVLCEHEMQGHYMRGMIAHAMDVIDRSCFFYQAFTHPDVYSYMWSIHPSLRTDKVYAILLERLGRELAALPWARTNRALRGSTVGADKRLRPAFHDYYEWTSTQLFARLSDQLDTDWLGRTGLFIPEAVEALCRNVQRRRIDETGIELFLWLLSFQRFAQLVNGLNRDILPVPADPTSRPPAPPSLWNRFQALARKNRPLVRAYRRIKPARQVLTRRRMLRRYPPDEQG